MLQSLCRKNAANTDRREFVQNVTSYHSSVTFCGTSPLVLAGASHTMFSHLTR